MSGHRVSGPISKKKKFVKDGVFFAELNDILAHEFADNGYAGCEVRVTPKSTEVYIRATHTKEVAGENNRRIREMRALIEKRFNFRPGKLNVYTAAVQNKGLSALAQAQAVKYRLLQGLSVRLAAYSVVKLIMDQRGAKGCEVIVSGKLRGQRAKAMKFRQGYMIHAGDPKTYYVEQAVKHVHLRQGVIGIKVKIMLPHDPEGEAGIKQELPDTFKIIEPKEEPVIIPESVQGDVEDQEEMPEDGHPEDPQTHDPEQGLQNQDEQYVEQGAADMHGQPPQNDPNANPNPNFGGQVQNDPAYMMGQDQGVNMGIPQGVGGVPRPPHGNFNENYNSGGYMMNQ